MAKKTAKQIADEINKLQQGGLGLKEAEAQVRNNINAQSVNSAARPQSRASQIAKQMEQLQRQGLSLQEAEAQVRQQTQSRAIAQTPSVARGDLNVQGFDPLSQATVDIAKSQLETETAALESSSNLFDVELSAAEKVLNRRLGLEQQLSGLAIQEQTDLFERGIRDIESQQEEALETLESTQDILLESSEQQQRQAQFQAALTGRSSFAAQTAVNNVIDSYQGQITDAQKAYFKSAEYLGNLASDLSTDAIREITKVNLESSDKINEALDTYTTAVEKITEGKRANEEQKALISRTIGAELQKNLIEIQNDAADRQREIIKDDRQFALQQAGLELDVENLALAKDKLSFDIDKFNITESRMSKLADAQIQETFASIDRGYKNLAISEAQLSQAERNYGLKLAEFQADREDQAKAVELQEAALALEAAELQNENSLGSVNDTYNTFADQVVSNPSLFAKLTGSERTEIVKNLVSRGQDISALGNDDFASLKSTDIDGIAQTLTLYKQIDDMRKLSEGVNTGKFAAAKQAGKEAIGIGQPEDFTVLQQATGKNLAQFIKSISGAAVSDQERATLEKLVPNVGQTDKTFDVQLNAMEDELKRMLDSRVAQFGFDDIDALSQAVGANEIPSLFDRINDAETRAKYTGDTTEEMELLKQFQGQSGILSKFDQDYIDSTFAN